MGMEEMHGRIVVQAGGPVSVVALHGEHDHVSKSQLEGIVGTLLDESSTRAVIVDLSDTDFVNLPVVGALVRATERSATGGKHLLVVLPEEGRPIVRRLFDVIEADAVLRLMPSMAEAMKAADKQAES